MRETLCSVFVNTIAAYTLTTKSSYTTECYKTAHPAPDPIQLTAFITMGMGITMVGTVNMILSGTTRGPKPEVMLWTNF